MTFKSLRYIVTIAILPATFQITHAGQTSKPARAIVHQGAAHAAPVLCCSHLNKRHGIQLPSCSDLQAAQWQHVLQEAELANTDNSNSTSSQWSLAGLRMALPIAGIGYSLWKIK